jgi:hypothetical protein
MPSSFKVPAAPEDMPLEHFCTDLEEDSSQHRTIQRALQSCKRCDQGVGHACQPDTLETTLALLLQQHIQQHVQNDLTA